MQLPERPGTGYAWKVSGTAVGSVVERVQEHLEPGDDESGEVGMPAPQVWMDRGTAAGTGALISQGFPPGADAASGIVAFEVSVGAPLGAAGQA